MTAASCLTVLGDLYGQLTYRLAWYHEHTADMATELFQPLDLVCGTLYQSKCAIQTSPMDWSEFKEERHAGLLTWTLCWTSSVSYLRRRLAVNKLPLVACDTILRTLSLHSFNTKYIEI